MNLEKNTNCLHSHSLQQHPRGPPSLPSICLHGVRAVGFPTLSLNLPGSTGPEGQTNYKVKQPD